MNQYNSFRSLRIEITEYDPYLLDHAATEAELELIDRLDMFDPKRGAYIGCCFYRDYDVYEYELVATMLDELSELARQLDIEAFIAPLMP